MPAARKIYSGEPLPEAPLPLNPEHGAFHRKLLDYIRRLTAKLDQYTGGGGGGGGGGTGETHIQSIACYMEEDQDTSDTFVSIPWANELWKDSIYTHTVPERIVVEADGLYLISLALQNEKGGFYTTDVRISISNADGSNRIHPIFAERVLGSGPASLYGTYNYTLALPLLASKAITIFWRVQNLGTPFGDDLKAYACSLVVSRIRANARGGDHTNPGLGWDTTFNGIPSWAAAW